MNSFDNGKTKLSRYKSNHTRVIAGLKKQIEYNKIKNYMAQIQWGMYPQEKYLTQIFTMQESFRVIFQNFHPLLQVFELL